MGTGKQRANKIGTKKATDGQKEIEMKKFQRPTNKQRDQKRVRRRQAVCKSQGAEMEAGCRYRPSLSTPASCSSPGRRFRGHAAAAPFGHEAQGMAEPQRAVS